MNDITRRQLLSTAVVAGTALHTEESVRQPTAARSADEKRRDRERVVAG